MTKDCKVHADKGMGCSFGKSWLKGITWIYCPEHARLRGNERVDALAGKTVVDSGDDQRQQG